MDVPTQTQGASTAEISLARHKLLTGRNDAVRQAYEKAVRGFLHHLDRL